MLLRNTRQYETDGDNEARNVEDDASIIKKAAVEK